MINDNIGYLRLISFALSPYDEFMKALSELKGAGMKSLLSI